MLTNGTRASDLPSAAGPPACCPPPPAGAACSTQVPCRYLFLPCAPHCRHAAELDSIEGAKERTAAEAVAVADSLYSVHLKEEGEGGEEGAHHKVCGPDSAWERVLRGSRGSGRDA